MYKKDDYPKCNDARKCFAKENGECTALIETYENLKCPFCKTRVGDRVGPGYIFELEVVEGVVRV